MVYFDNAATTPLWPEVQQLISNNLDKFGNASTLYEYGYEARQALEQARATIAELIHAEPEEIYFTSGGSEADTQAIFTFCNKRHFHVVSSSIEHPAVSDAIALCRKWFDGSSTYVHPEDRTGLIHFDDVNKAITNNTTLVTCMAVNNEIGTTQQIDMLSDVAHKCNKPFFADCVQLFPHCKVDVRVFGADMMSASAHKFGGPKGVGFLYCKKDYTPIKLIRGGGQERGCRAGTENVLGAMAMAEALTVTYDKNDCGYLSELCATLSNELKTSGLHYIENGDIYNTNGIRSISFKNLRGDEIQAMMEDRGFAISTGSACHSGVFIPSDTMRSVRCPAEYINGTIRISLSVRNTKEEVISFVQALKEVIQILEDY